MYIVQYTTRKRCITSICLDLDYSVSQLFLRENKKENRINIGTSQLRRLAHQASLSCQWRCSSQNIFFPFSYMQKVRVKYQKSRKNKNKSKNKQTKITSTSEVLLATRKTENLKTEQFVLPPFILLQAQPSYGRKCYMFFYIEI